MSSLKWREGTLWVEMICKCKSSYFLLDSHEGTSASWCLDNARYINWFNFFMICNISPKLYFSDMCVSVFYTFLYICIKLLSKAVDFVLPSGLLFTLINFLFVCFIWVIRAQARSWWDHWRGCCCSERFPLEWALGERMLAEPGCSPLPFHSVHNEDGLLFPLLCGYWCPPWQKRPHISETPNPFPNVPKTGGEGGGSMAEEFTHFFFFDPLGNEAKIGF